MAETTPYSNIQEFKKHWPAMPADRETEAIQKLLEASIEIRAEYPDLEERLNAGKLDREVVRLVVNRMVKRAIDIPMEDYAGVQSATAQAGPLAQTLNFSNPDGSVYMSKKDHRLLRGASLSQEAFTILPGGPNGPR